MKTGVSPALRIIGPSYRGTWTCIAGFWDLQTTSFEIPWFLGGIIPVNHLDFPKATAGRTLPQIGINWKRSLSPRQGTHCGKNLGDFSQWPWTIQRMPHLWTGAALIGLIGLIPKNHGISNLVVWRSQNPAKNRFKSLYRRVQWFLGIWDFWVTSWWQPCRKIRGDSIRSFPPINLRGPLKPAGFSSPVA